MRTTSYNRISTILFFSSFVAVLVYLTVVITGMPSIGVLLAKESEQVYIVQSVEPGSQAKTLGISPGDQIMTVNDQPAHHYKNVIKYHSLEYADHVLVKHKDGTTAFIQFTKDWTSGYSTKELMLQLYVPGISLLIFFAFSAFLYVKRKDDPAARMLILFFMSIGICYYSSAASHRSDPVGLSVIYVILPIISLIFMKFMNIYLQRFNTQFISARALRSLFILAGSVSAFSLLYIWTNLFEFEVLSFIKIAFGGVVLIGNLICLYHLVHKFMKHRRSKLKSLFTITLTSHVIAFSPFATMNLLPLLLGQKQILPAAFTALFLFVLPIVYFYLSTSNQLFDIDFILTRFKYYTALSLIPAVLVATAVSLLLLRSVPGVWAYWFYLFLIAFIGMTLFLYAKEQIDQRFRPKIFKAMYSYQDSLDRFSRSVARVMKQADLEAVLKQEISSLLPVNRLTFLIVDQEEQTVYPMTDDQEVKVTADFLLGIVSTFKLGELIDLPYGLGLIIGKQRSRYHVLWIGLKTNHTRFNTDEIRWLKTMANYSSIVFENLYLIEGLIEDLESEVRKEQTTSPWVLRMLFLLSENERRKLAADLHDSALQDQLIWYRKLEAVMMDHPLTDKLGGELEQIKEGLLDVIHQIRETCNELRPPLLKEMGVVEAVESIIEHTQMRVNFEVQFRSAPFHEQLDEEQITAIYRIVQELLRNADKHAGAKLVQLELELREGTIYFRYQDDGVGMDVNHMVESFEHMGLSGIKERVASLEGDISFYSEPGKGLEVIILMPVIMSNGLSERGISHDSYLIS
ncbi:PDZ domain-containing protein [Paenibacillus nanensis]|uniref:histidine kinase n=1 Tax=Paenibacillus nanensis TaxID=393251 RepID=A0A3A1UZY5_9BACL|nr:ATP-binding protein [Paenibacillus nanensis]RIX50850.1 PDZ domain-containing protein [Paenibacillus nanensis]